MQLPYFIAVSDGYQIRTIHPPALGDWRETVEAILERLVLPSDDPRQETLPFDIEEGRDTSPRTTTRAQELAGAAVVARAAGFTGDMCTQCGSMEVVRTGTCCTCQACGTPSGGCS